MRRDNHDFLKNGSEIFVAKGLDRLPIKRSDLPERLSSSRGPERSFKKPQCGLAGHNRSCSPCGRIAKFANDLFHPTRLRAAEIFSILWAAISRLRQSRRHSVRLSPCFCAQRPRCGPIEATNVNKFCRAQKSQAVLSFLRNERFWMKGSWLARRSETRPNQRQCIWYRQQECQQK